MTKHQKELEERLLGQLRVTKDDLRQWNSDSYLMDGRVVATFWDYVDKAPAIGIVGDYDVDGICSCYEMSKSIKSLYPSKRVGVRIPKRFSEGYGINKKIADEMREKLPKGSLIITVDNGIAAAPVLEELKADGYKVIVTDHHELGKNKIPEVDMVLNPSVPECASGFTGDYWCGAGVVYKICEQMVDASLAKELMCYAGLATVADCMKLKEGNWGLVRHAIQEFREGKAPKPLMNMVSAMKQDAKYCNTDTFGFYLGPAFNAAGRLHDEGAKEVLSYLINPTPDKLLTLIGLNEERKRLRDEEYELVKQEIAITGQENAPIIWVALPALHEGIVGILAGKVSEEYGVPAVVMTPKEDDPDVLKGSARSVPGISIFDHLISCGDIFEGFGGHDGAAGLSLTKDNFKIAKSVPLTQTGTVVVDGKRYMDIDKTEIPEILSVVEHFMPFGEGNPTPAFGVNIDTHKDIPRMIGQDKNHFMLDRMNDGYKIMHFYHEPNTLADKDHFKMIGSVSLSGWNGLDYANFNAEAIEDIVEDREMENYEIQQ